MCLTFFMERACNAALEALEATVETCTRNGLTEAWSVLVRDVYSQNLDRYEPDELGDTAMSFGVQCYENLRTRAIRRFQHDDLEAAAAHWDVDGLRVGTPKNVLTFSLGNLRVVTMKVPFAEGRSPNWDRSGDWDQYSQIRLAFATENSRVLQYRSPAADAFPLFPHLGAPGRVQSYMLLWAGEANSALTAGWLGVPVLGDTPFIARKTLWWDDESDTRSVTKGARDRGPSFDERPSIMPEVTFKKRPQEGEA